MAMTVEALYGDEFGTEDVELEAILQRSLQPRGSDVLYQMFAQLGVNEKHRIIDVGGRDARHTIRLAKRFGCQAVMFDAVTRHLGLAHANVETAGMAQQIFPLLALIEAVPLRSELADFIWCRDVLNHVDLPSGLASCYRLLKSGGKMLIYQTFGTSLMEPKEADRLYRAMAIVPQNMSMAYFEKTAVSQKFNICKKDYIDSEWREKWAEEGDQSLLTDLLTVARLRRSEAALREQFGDQRYEVTYADCLWGIYQMLGKLCPTVYVLEKA